MNKQSTNRLFFWGYRQLLGICLFGLSAIVPFSKPVYVYAFEADGGIAAPFSRLENWRFYPEALQLEITLSAASQPRSFYLAQPPRIVVDLPNTKLSYVPTQQNYPGAIQSIRVSQFTADVTRIVLDLAPGTFINPNQIQLQPVSLQNQTRWVLRPEIASNNFSPQPFNEPSGFYNPPPRNLPPQPFNEPSGFYNLPPRNLPPQPFNEPSGFYNPPPRNLPPQPFNEPSGFYNPPQAPAASIPPPSTALPPVTPSKQKAPFVTVPPLAPRNSSPRMPGSALPPATFPNQPLPAPNFPVPTVPNSSNNFPPGGVIEFGQPFPNSR